MKKENQEKREKKKDEGRSWKGMEQTVAPDRPMLVATRPNE